MRFFRNARDTSTCDQRGTSVELVQELTKTILKLYQYCLFKTFHDHSNSIDTLQAIIFSLVDTPNEYSLWRNML